MGGCNRRRPCDTVAPVRRARVRTSAALVVGSVLLLSGVARAQSAPASPPAPPGRSDAWNTATNILAASALGVELVMPRVFFSDPDVTAGYKARWHVSALAPVMTTGAIALINEVALKDSFSGLRPDCTDETQGTPGCTSFGFLSTQAFVAGSALGQGVGTFLVDTMKYSGGQVNAGALIGEIGVPLVLAPITAIGRTSGNWESGGQAWGSAAIGLGVGLALGTLYAEMQRPECGYTGNLICW
jgi:hypothetical protein